jgi:Uma2 family endonuclease
MREAVPENVWFDEDGQALVVAVRPKSRLRCAMTVTEDRPQMLAEEFERIAAAEREGVRLEFVHGELGAKRCGRGSRRDHPLGHGALHAAAPRPVALPGTRLEGGDLPKRPRQAERGLGAQGQFRRSGGVGAVADQVVMVVEVTSYDTDKRDREDKPRAYAQTGIPVYLLIDRESRETLVYSEPDGGAYGNIARRCFGKTIALPAPVGITLDTEPLKDWVR